MLDFTVEVRNSPLPRIRPERKRRSVVAQGRGIERGSPALRNAATWCRKLQVDRLPTMDVFVPCAIPIFCATANNQSHARMHPYVERRVLPRQARSAGLMRWKDGD